MLFSVHTKDMDGSETIFTVLECSKFDCLVTLTNEFYAL
jgi:hypothetical protein